MRVTGHTANHCEAIFAETRSLTRGRRLFLGREALRTVEMELKTNLTVPLWAAAETRHGPPTINGGQKMALGGLDGGSLATVQITHHGHHGMMDGLIPMRQAIREDGKNRTEDERGKAGDPFQVSNGCCVIFLHFTRCQPVFFVRYFVIGFSWQNHSVRCKILGA
mmetsp:Transcript_41707/g.73260  ORF Transcript_41707/g.73260 Transcript_41707/m.73260 type:complete len:165 (+) Transcript_41707:1917-2411(+)